MARSKKADPMAYLPPSLAGGSMPGAPQQGGPSPIGKSRSIQMMGGVSGRAAAGITKGMLGPDQQFRHAFGHYGKAKESKL